jgi:hypothetical protein
MNDPYAEPGIPPEKPTLLPVLLVLSYINTGFFLLLYTIGLFAMLGIQALPYDEFQARIQDQLAGFPQTEELENMEEVLMLLHASGALLFTILLARTVVRMVGVVMMHRRRLTGFHVYAAAQLLGLFAPFIVLPWSMLGIFGPLMVVLMVALYGSQRKWLNREVMEIPMG